jgi:hypothetical protein
MSFWSVNYLFLANAALLIFLACFPVWRRAAEITWIFFATNIAVALWNVCFFLIEERVGMDYLDVVVRVQMMAGLVLANGLYYFCSSYPVRHPSKANWLNAAIFVALTVGILHPSIVTSAVLVNGEVEYRDGPGFALYMIYGSLLGLLAVYNLARAWKRYPEHRSRIRYFFIGIFVYVAAAIIFNLVMPFLGIYDFLIAGRLATTVASIFFFYAITKHDFLDITVIINKAASWITTLGILLGVALVLDSYTQPWPALNVAALFVVVVVSALYAQPMHQFLLTTAKRKFVRGWYSTEEVINRLSGRITTEKNREAIFKEVARVIDEVFELEDIMTIVAVRDEHEAFSYYKIIGKFQKIRSNDPLIETMRNQTDCLLLEDAPEPLLRRMEELHFVKGKTGMILPFHSPEFLEGVMLLGERSNQTAYSESDLRFFNT